MMIAKTAPRMREGVRVELTAQELNRCGRAPARAPTRRSRRRSASSEPAEPAPRYRPRFPWGVLMIGRRVDPVELRQQLRGVVVR